VTIPAVNQDSIYAFVEKQLSFGFRIPGQQGHTDCKNWLVSKLESYGTKVIQQDFPATFYTGETVQATNIIAQINPLKKKRILLAAHYDTRRVADYDRKFSNRSQPIAGADDGASGVAVLIEIARTISENPIDLGVDIIFFDAEDQGETKGPSNYWCLGSQYWSRNIHVARYRPEFGILLDMVGAKNPRFAKDYVSRTYAGKVLNKVWRLAQNMGYSDKFVNENGGEITDDHYFVNTIAKIPMIDIINQPINSQTGFVPHWHTLDDDIHVINKRTMRVVGQVVAAVLYKSSDDSF
jgi:hypothetical protein